ncbi:hypothetical protein ACFE04_031865 [Oxalis oulophora]
MAPLTSVILGSLLVYLTHAEKHGVQVIGNLKKGLNPLSAEYLVFSSPYMGIAIKTGIITGIVALAEGIAVGRSFAMFKNYHIDGNKEMIAFGMMNIVGSCTSCYLTTGPFSRSAVNYNAGCKTAVSNVVMAIAVMFTLMFLTPLFHYTPLVVLASIIISAMLSLIDYEAAIHLYKVDKFDFVICMSAYIGVVFGSVELGLIIAVGISVLRVLLFVARPRTFVKGNIPNSTIYRNVEQYTNANRIPGILILEIDAPIYFANTNYLRERISRWIDEEEEKLKSSGETSLQYIILDISAVGNIDTSGISMFEEIKKTSDRRGFKLVLANPGAEVIKKLNKSKFIENIGQEWIFVTVGEAVASCNYMLHTSKPNAAKGDQSAESWNNKCITMAIMHYDGLLGKKMLEEFFACQPSLDHDDIEAAKNTIDAFLSENFKSGSALLDDAVALLLNANATPEDTQFIIRPTLRTKEEQTKEEEAAILANLDATIEKSSEWDITRAILCRTKALRS